MSETRAYLNFLMRRGSYTAHRAAMTLHRASVKRNANAERAAFRMLCAYLTVIASVIDELPADLLELEPRFPWREFSRLPDLLARPDFNADGRVVWRTLDMPLRQLRFAAQYLYQRAPMPDTAFSAGSEETAHGAGFFTD